MRHVRETTAVCLGTGLGFGYFPVASGTVGSLWGILGRCLLPGLAGYVVLVLLMGAGIWAAGVCEDIFRKKDSGKIVIDEVVGMWMVCLPFRPRPWVLLACFLLFRFWDIVKPPLASRSQEIQGGLGVMADDVLAAGYAIFSVAVLHWINIL